jgi:hypothetical protein
VAVLEASATVGIAVISLFGFHNGLCFTKRLVFIVLQFPTKFRISYTTPLKTSFVVAAKRSTVALCFLYHIQLVVRSTLHS